MLVSKELKIVICTPTKTGTESLTRTLTIRPEFRYVLPKHGIPETSGMTDGWRRILMVRNPYDRIRSIYYWCISHGANRGSNFASRACRDAYGGKWCNFAKFLEFHRTYGHPTFGWNYSQIAEEFEPTEIWKLEDIDNHMVEFADHPRMPRCSHCQHPMMMRTNTYSAAGWWVKHKIPPTEFGKRELKLIESWAKPDCNTFGYKYLEG